jgi:DNA-binding transcriptional LysR family regulator
MEFHQLEAFVQVVETGSFRAASERLNKAQSAISLAIRNLENELGFALFDRSSYRPHLSPQGQSLLPQVRALLRQSDFLLNYGRFLKEGFEPRVTLGVTHLWPQKLLVPVIQNFILQFPLTELIICPETLSADELLEQEKIDLSLGEVFNEKMIFETRSVGHLKMVPVCSSRHPLAQFHGVASKSELIKHRQVVLKSTAPESQRVAGVEPEQIQIGVQDFAMKKELLLRGVGWGSMPHHLVEQELKSGKLVKTHRGGFRVPVFLAWNKKKTLGPCAQFLLSALSENRMEL